MEKKIKEKILKQLHKKYDAAQVDLEVLIAEVSVLKNIIDKMEKDILDTE